MFRTSWTPSGERRSPRHSGRRGTVAAATLLIATLLGTTRLLEAHDFWLIPDAFAIASGGTVTTLGQSGTRFPASESAVAPSRVADARLIGASGTARITDLAEEGTSLRLRQTPAADGQYLVAVMLQPHETRAAVAGFRRYLELEGAADEAARLDREGAFRGRDSVRYRATKYATTVVEVGTGPRAFATESGFPLQLTPTSDPAALRVGGTAHVRVTSDGRPLAGLRVHAGAAADSALRRRGAPGGDPDLHLLTDSNGVIQVPVTKAGWWNVRAAYVVPRGNPEAGEWDVYWTTFVFHVSGTGGGDAAGRSPQQADAVASDSAEVAQTLERWQRALAAGDSATALALLAPDAIVLESGDVETRAEYRAHHLGADIAFVRAVPSTRTRARIVVDGDVAWATSTSTTQGTFRGRPVNSAGAELMVLTRAPAGWSIRAIHWSSHTRRSRAASAAAAAPPGPADQ